MTKTEFLNKWGDRKGFALDLSLMLQTEKKETDLQIHDVMEIIQDHCDLLSEQPQNSKRPFIKGARAKLDAFIEKHKIATGPKVMTASDKR